MSLKDQMWWDKHGPKKPKGKAIFLDEHKKERAYEKWRWPFSMYIETDAEPIILVTNEHDLMMGVSHVSEECIQELGLSVADSIEYTEAQKFDSIEAAEDFTKDTEKRPVRYTETGKISGRKNFEYIGYSPGAVERKWGCYWTDRLGEGGRVWVDVSDECPDSESKIPFVDGKGKKNMYPLSVFDLEWIRVVPPGIEAIPWVNEHNLDAPRKDQLALEQVFTRFLKLACRLAVEEHNVESITISGRHREEETYSYYARGNEYEDTRIVKRPTRLQEAEQAMTSWENIESFKLWRGKWEDEGLMSMMFEPEWLYIKKIQAGGLYRERLFGATHRFPVYVDTADELQEVILERSRFDYDNFDPTRWY